MGGVCNKNKGMKYFLRFYLRTVILAGVCGMELALPPFKKTFYFRIYFN